MGGMYCQSWKEIAAGIYHCLNVVHNLIMNRFLVFILLFQDQKYQHLQEKMSATNGWIYFGMQPYGHFEEDESGELLLFYIKEHKEDIIEYFLIIRRILAAVWDLRELHVIWITGN